jgi:hypothetical protein
VCRALITHSQDHARRQETALATLHAPHRQIPRHGGNICPALVLQLMKSPGRISELIPAADEIVLLLRLLLLPCIIAAGAAGFPGLARTLKAILISVTLILAFSEVTNFSISLSLLPIPNLDSVND